MSDFFEYIKNHDGRPIGADPAEEPEPNGHNTKRRFQFTRFCDIRPSPEPAYTVDRLIPRRGVVVIWGKPKCGKTFWTFDVEIHVALGWTYRGQKVEQGEVLHIACEGVAGLAMRKEAWRLHHIEGQDAATVELIDAAPFHLCKETALDLIKDVDTVVHDIVAQFGDRPIKIITIDTLNRSLRGSESKDQDMAAYVRAATLLAEKFQCAVIIIHHCGHSEDRPRGHSSLLGAVDALIEIKKDERGLVHSKVEEMRDGPTGQTTVSRLQVVDVIHDINGELITSCVIVEDTTAAPEQQRKAGSKPPSPMAQKFYEALANAAADLSKVRPASFGKPSITEDEWIRNMERTRLLNPLPASDDRSAYRKACQQRDAKLSKYRSELIAADWVRCNDKVIWSIRKEA